MTIHDDLPTFRIELETSDVTPDKVRVKLIQAPDSEGESRTYWPENPLYQSYSSDVELGQALFDCLFGHDEPNEIGRRLQRYYQAECLIKPGGLVCLRILLNFSSIKGRAELAVSLPWELLFDGHNWLGIENHWLARDSRLSIARRTATRAAFDQPAGASLRVLLAYAEPVSLKPFKGEAYLETIANALKEIDWLDLVQLPHASRTTLKKHIADGFHVVHFLGHGEAKASEETGLDAFLHLENEKVPDKSDRLSANEFAGWFGEARIKPRLVVLTACQSGITGRFGVLGTAQALLDTGIDAVVAMQAMLRLKEARTFAPAFYQQLAGHANVDDALQAGRQALDNFWSSSLQTGAEESLERLLKPRELRLPQADDVGGFVDDDASLGEEANQTGGQTVKFPAWAVPILLLNGDSRLGQEPPPPLIYWGLKEHDIALPMVYIPEEGFYIDKYPVIREDYAKFAADWKSPNWADNTTPEQFQDYPATNMSFEDAQKFAVWTGRRLPSVAQWQRAALSGIPDKTQRYPWGNEPGPPCNIRPHNRQHDLNPISVRVEAELYKQNTNPSGMCGIIGNVADFAEDNGKISICGGHCKEVDKNVGIEIRASASPQGSSLVGFRCVAGWREIKLAVRTGKLTLPLSQSVVMKGD